MPTKQEQTKKNEDLILSILPIDQLTQIIRDCVRKEVDKTQPINSDNNDLIRVEDAVKLLKVSKVTLYKWRRAGIIPYHRIASRIYFKKSEIIEALKTSRRFRK